MYKGILLVFFVFVVVMAGGIVAAAVPQGANYTEVSTSDGGTRSPQGHSAYAGNVTELTVSGFSITQAWQGYFGNVTGTIELTDGSSNVMYNWSQTSAEGEIFAANASSISWSNVGCYNLSDAEFNTSWLEDAFNVNSSDVDGVDETFALNNHATFIIGTTTFSSGECNNTQLYNNVGAGTFDEILMFDSDNNATVFAAILSDDTTGFDSDTHDFEMMVIEDGHSGDASPTTYYFYLELDA